MFKPEDFELPLEKVLKLRVITDEIDNCTDINVLKESLKQISKLLMTYQHLLSAVLKEQLMINLGDLMKDGEKDKS
tara:strand:- start:316 stop:543 length:228 start_codon:yes stop_codon:yes gene_type:complete